MDEKHIEILIEVEQRSKSNMRRIEDLEGESKSNNKLVSSVEKLTLEIKYMREDYQKLSEKHTEEVKAIDDRLKEIERKPADNWEKIKWLIVTGIVTAILGFMLGKFGF